MPNGIERWFVYLRTERRQSDGSIRRYRASVSSFFAWWVAEHRRADNPVAPARLPTRPEPPTEMRPYSEDELAEVVDRIRARSTVLADVTLIAGWTVLRLGRASGCACLRRAGAPSPAFWVARSQTEGGKVKVTKGRWRGGCRWLTSPSRRFDVRRRASHGRTTWRLGMLAASCGAPHFSGLARGNLWRWVAGCTIMPTSSLCRPGEGSLAVRGDRRSGVGIIRGPRGR
jgi:hypothetical protein